MPALISQAQLGQWLVSALGHLGGRAQRAEVLVTMALVHSSELSDADRALVANGSEPAWTNRTSFARNDLIAAGILVPKAQAGRGIWELTAAGWSLFRSFATASDPAAEVMDALCPSFRIAATDVWWRIGTGRTIGLVPWETTFTDNALFNLAIAHPHQIHIERFGSAKEASTGADWEWWFRDAGGFAGFRIQAKRADPSSGHINLRQDAPATSTAHRYQIELFHQQCLNDGITGLYCIYGDRQPAPSAGVVAAGPCPHGPYDPSQWGCSTLLVQTALRHLNGARVSSRAVLQDAKPWFHLVCTGSAPLVTGLTSHLRGYLGSMLDGEAEFQERQQDRDYRAAVAAAEPPHDVLAYFRGGEGGFEPRDGLDGVVLVDVLPRHVRQ